VAFGAFTGVLYLVSSCASDDPAGSPAATAPAGTEAVDTAATATSGAPATEAPAPETTDGAPPPTDAAPVAAFEPPDGNPELLREWSQLAVEDGQLVMLDGVTPYTLNSALFTDYAQKLRTVWLPDGSAAATYDPDETFDFPVGTIITKTFYYPVPDDAAAGDPEVLQLAADDSNLAEPLDLTDVRLIETRVLAHRDDGWHAFPYVWNDDETEATLERTGDVVSLAAFSPEGDQTDIPYIVPDVNQCASCHATNHSSGQIQPIGPKARHLNGSVDFGDGPEPQLERWIRGGLLIDAPEATEVPAAADWTDDSESLDDRARAYLDINCAHCHNPAGAADTSGLFLDTQTELGPELGVCKTPIAAGSGTGGREYDIVPGSPDESIIVFRMETTDPAAMMPELGRSDFHEEGVDLISEWIASLDGDC
jgi:uncharacterized repeat protein (TIGR03806 family)